MRDSQLDTMELRLTTLNYCGNCSIEMYRKANFIECPNCGNTYNMHFV